MNEQEAAIAAARARLAEQAQRPPGELFDRLVARGIITPHGQLAGSVTVGSPARAGEPNGGSNGKK